MRTVGKQKEKEKKMVDKHASKTKCHIEEKKSRKEGYVDLFIYIYIEGQVDFKKIRGLIEIAVYTELKKVKNNLSYLT
jgi:hypothetical protein